MLRVLGRLWPLFQSPGTPEKDIFCRRSKRNLSFIAQRPYVFDGSLRKQVAYPVWENSLLGNLDDAALERLFREADLSSVREPRKHDLDAENINWTDVFEIGGAATAAVLPPLLGL